MSAAHQLKLTPDEFLEWENRQEEKHEYHQGDVYPMNRGAESMAGGTEPHATVITNTLVALDRYARPRGCKVYTEAMRVRVAAADVFTYPDLSVVCGAPQFHDARKTALLNPLVVVEVLSPSTQNYDRTLKFDTYAQIPELESYVLISQDNPAVDVYTRDGDGWHLTHTAVGDAAVPALDCALSMSELYDGVDFPDPGDLLRPAPLPGRPGNADTADADT